MAVQGKRFPGEWPEKNKNGIYELQFYKLLNGGIPMAKKTIAELLQEAKVLREAEKKLKQEMKEKKSAIAVEYADNLSPEAKQEQIADAEKILQRAKVGLENAKAIYKQEAKRIKDDVSFAKEILAFVSYKQNNSLPKRKNSSHIEGNFLVFNREGIKEIRIDVTKIAWEKVYKQELAKQGINGENRIADNLVYQAQLLCKAKNIKTS